MERKKFFFILFFCLFLFIGCPDNILLERALKIHESAFTVDTHVDTPFMVYYQDLDLGEYHDPHEVYSKVDFPRMEQGDLDAIFFAFWVAQGPRTPEGNEDAQELFLNLYNATYT